MDRIASQPGMRLLVAASPKAGVGPALEHQRSALIRAYLMSNGLEHTDVVFEAPRKLKAVLPPAKDSRTRLILLMPG